MSISVAARSWRSIVCAMMATVAVTIATGVACAEEPPIWEREKLTGSWGGARSSLEQRGIEIGAEYIGETFGVASGGVRRGSTYGGILDVSVDTDLEKLFGWTGAKAHIKAYQIHNSGANSADYAGALSDPSNINALPTTRLFTAWLQQDFGKSGSLRIGQLAADDEFLTSETASALVNGTFGWANIVAANLPSGGAAYPLATPGARLQLNLNDNISLLGGVFSGDPAGRGCYAHDADADPQACNRHGTTFSFSGGSLWIGELQYQVNQDKDAAGLPAAYKIGGWYHNGGFANQRLGVNSAGDVVPLALNPENSLNHHGNWSVYGVIDQMLWRSAETSVSVFARGGIVPSDRNLISWYVDAGVGIKGPVPGRPNDVLAFGFAYSKIGSAARAFDRDTFEIDGAPYPIRSGETAFELSYSFQVTPWWVIQPDVQYIVRPEGGVLHPDNPNRRIGDAVLIGARTSVAF